MQSGGAFIPSHHAEILERLPAKTFQVQEDKKTEELFLELVPSFTLPERVYGSARSDASRILRTYFDRTEAGKGTGVIMSGGKGSGKTLTAKMLSIELAAAGVPTIVVSHPYHGSEFFSFMSTIDQRVVVLFDEFEKVYCDQKKQLQLLSLFDGVAATAGKLFVVTINDRRGVSDYFFNRPGRFYYNFEFAGLSEEFIVDYCRDNLESQDAIADVVKLSRFYSDFNFDVLQTVVEEVNRFKCSVKEAVAPLNTTPFHDKKTWKIADATSFRGTTTEISPKEFSPLKEYTYVSVKDSNEEDSFYLGPENIVDYKIDRVTYETTRGRIVLEVTDDKPTKVVRVSDLL